MDALLRPLCVKPVWRIERTAYPYKIVVHFQDGTQASHKDDIKLRLFLAAMQTLVPRRIEGNRSHCLPSPVGLYGLLGVEPGDAFLFSSDTVSLPIEFASPEAARPSAGTESDR